MIHLLSNHLLISPFLRYNISNNTATSRIHVPSKDPDVDESDISVIYNYFEIIQGAATSSLPIAKDKQILRIFVVMLGE